MYFVLCDFSRVEPPTNSYCLRIKCQGTGQMKETIVTQCVTYRSGHRYAQEEATEAYGQKQHLWASPFLQGWHHVTYSGLDSLNDSKLKKMSHETFIKQPHFFTFLNISVGFNFFSGDNEICSYSVYWTKSKLGVQSSFRIGSKFIQSQNSKLGQHKLTGYSPLYQGLHSPTPTWRVCSKAEKRGVTSQLRDRR